MVPIIIFKWLQFYHWLLARYTVLYRVSEVFTMLSDVALKVKKILNLSTEKSAKITVDTTERLEACHWVGAVEERINGYGWDKYVVITELADSAYKQVVQVKRTEPKAIFGKFLIRK